MTNYIDSFLEDSLFVKGGMFFFSIVLQPNTPSFKHSDVFTDFITTDEQSSVVNTIQTDFTGVKLSS